MSKKQDVVFYLHHLNWDKCAVTLIDRIKEVEALTIADRNWLHDEDVLRLDSSRWHEVDAGPKGKKRNRLWLGNIACLRNDRPALGAWDAPVEDMVLKPGQDATEETAVLFDFENEVALIQYNHRGAKASGIAEYLTCIKSTPHLGVTLPNIIDSRWYNSRQAKQECHAVEVGVIPANLSAKFDSGSTSLNQAMKGMGKDVESGVVRVRFNTAGRPGDGFIQKLMHAITEDVDAITRANVSMRNVDTGKMDVFDLFSKREKYATKLRQNSSKRILPEDRWNALLTARGYLAAHFPQ